MSTDKPDLANHITKFISVPLILGITTIIINYQYQSKQVVLEEMKSIGQFVDYALDANPGKRRMFAEYFVAMTDSGSLRDRWTYYKDSIVGIEIDSISKQIDRKAVLYNSTDDLYERQEIKKQIIALTKLIEGNLQFAKYYTPFDRKNNGIFDYRVESNDSAVIPIINSNDSIALYNIQVQLTQLNKSINYNRNAIDENVKQSQKLNKRVDSLIYIADALETEALINKLLYNKEYTKVLDLDPNNAKAHRGILKKLDFDISIEDVNKHYAIAKDELFENKDYRELVYIAWAMYDTSAEQADDLLKELLDEYKKPESVKKTSQFMAIRIKLSDVHNITEFAFDKNEHGEQEEIRNGSEKDKFFMNYFDQFYQN